MSITELLDGIAELSSEEIQALADALQQRLSAASPESGPDAGNPARFTRYESIWHVILTGSGTDEVRAVKEVRRIHDCSLKEGISIVRNPPQIIKENCSEDEALEIRSRFEAFGASIELRRETRMIYDYANCPDGYAYD